MAVPSLAALMVGCGGEAAESVMTTGERVSADCATADTTSGFVTRAFARQGGRFWIHFDATPAVAPSDALAGVTLGSADGYGDLAAIVRFNPSGFLDARNGNTYQASRTIPYSAGVTRAIRLQVDLITRTYSAWVDGELLAERFSFRTQQSSVMTLDGLALKVDAGAGLSACNLRVVTQLTCDSAAPGQGFVNTSLPPSSPAFTATFMGVPRATNMDGVMGVSATAASSFPALAAAVRFGASGSIEALDGAGYKPLGAQPYAANTGYRFTIIADAVDHTYMLVGPHSEDPSTLRFRVQQANVAALGNFAKVSDSPAGALTVCDLQGGGAQGAVWIHDASRYGDPWPSLAVSNDRLLLSGTGRTLVLDSRGAVARELPYGGRSATDAQGNLYLFGKFVGSYNGGTGTVYPTAGGGNVYVSKYDSSFNPIYTRVMGTTADVELHSPSADSQGNVAFVLRNSATSAGVKLDASGETVWSSDYPLDAIALGPSGQIAVAIGDASSVTLSMLSAGQALWSRTFPAQGVSLRGVVFDGGGNIVFWGDIDGQIEFGETTLVAQPEEGDLGLLGSLGPDGAPRFVRTTPINSIRRVVPDRAGHVIVAGTNNHWLDGIMWQLERYDAAGALTARRGGEHLLPPFTAGPSGDAAVDSVGHVYWQVHPILYDNYYPYFLAKLRPF